MSLSRRQFIQASGIALCAGAVPLRANAAGQQQPLPIPPLLESRRGQPAVPDVAAYPLVVHPGDAGERLGR
ncbi:Cell division protein FtsP precursor [Leclercia adecarboxylata]|uniref:Cell division protein FtsP n=1 Tax=Leclercia adecarboxylata TaxID=83655 RepID=A0A4U9IPC1_9ENTR|nr:Cell division protein FtsP precursor [Leclercia adecarboxylata]